MNERSVNDSFTKLLEIVCEADETTPRDVRALARTLAEFGYYTAKGEDATDDANALLEEATEVFFYHVKELLDGNEEIKVGDKVRLKHKLKEGDESATDQECTINEYMEPIPTGDVGEVEVVGNEVNDGHLYVLFESADDSWWFHPDDVEKV